MCQRITHNYLFSVPENRHLKSLTGYSANSGPGFKNKQGAVKPAGIRREMQDKKTGPCARFFLKEPLNNSAQLCASLSGLKRKATEAENGAPFSRSPTPLYGPESRALRGWQESPDSVSPGFDRTRYACNPAS